MKQNDRNIQWDTSPYMARQTLQSAHPLQMGLEAQGDGPQEACRKRPCDGRGGRAERESVPLLGFGSHKPREKYVFPTVAPVFRQTGGYSLGMLG